MWSKLKRWGRRSGESVWRRTPSPASGAVVLDVATSVVPYLALTAAMYALLGSPICSCWLLAVPAAGFLLRTFIVFHDCTHGSFLPWRQRQQVARRRRAALLVYSPFHIWRHEHAIHHATAGDLDHRGMGDVDTLTVAEYARCSPAAAGSGIG